MASFRGGGVIMANLEAKTISKQEVNDEVHLISALYTSNLTLHGGLSLHPVCIRGPDRATQGACDDVGKMPKACT